MTNSVAKKTDKEIQYAIAAGISSYDTNANMAVVFGW